MIMRLMERVSAVLLTLALSPACTGFEPGSDVLGTDQAENLPPPPPGQDWRCLAGADLSTGPTRSNIASPETRLIFSSQILDLSTGAIYPDVQVRACGSADIDCTAPVADSLTVDGRGWVDIPVFEGFTGFFEFRSPAILDTIFFQNERVEQPTRNDFPFIVVSRASVPPLLQLVGATPRANTGFLAVRARDCNDDTAAGVTFTLEEGEGTPFYFASNRPSRTATATDEAGIAVFVDMPVGGAVVRATNSEGTEIMTPQTIVMRDGWLSGLIARPPQALRTADE